MTQKTFPATLEGLAQATTFVESMLDEQGCPMKTHTSIMVALDEIASNIVHYSGAPDFTLEVDCAADHDEVRLTFSDAGRPYDPLAKADPDVTAPIATREVGGLGIFMVKKLMDGVTYAREDGRNVLVIRKRRTSPSESLRHAVGRGERP